MAIKKFLEERGWLNLRPGDIAKSISIEAAELLEVFQWTNPSLRQLSQEDELLDLAKDELADILNYCVEFAVLLKLNTDAIMREKLRKISQKYPAEMMKHMGNREARSDDLYWQIKRHHRANPFL